jgi:deazaflavin-dependent oxidoreductase (nitroreductase family)
MRERVLDRHFATEQARMKRDHVGGGIVAGCFFNGQIPVVEQVAFHSALLASARLPRGRPRANAIGPAHLTRDSGRTEGAEQEDGAPQTRERTLGTLLPMNALGRLFIAAHVTAYRASQGRIGGTIISLPVVLVTTTGRKTGKPRTVPVASFQDGGDVLVIASYGGSPQHPAWFANMMAKPEVKVQVGSRIYPARAEVVTGPDRERLWKMVVDRAPNFGNYQKKTTREIPVVRLRAMS